MVRQEWAAGVIARGRARGDIPVYGDEVWCSLPEIDPRRAAAAVIRAEHSLEVIAPSTWPAEAPAVRAAAANLQVDAESYAELQRRRMFSSARQDYPGGRIEWSR